MENRDQIPVVSIIIPIYSVEEYLSNCIESVISQTYTNIEIILVDDGSPDGCGRICDEYAQKDRRIKVIHKTNGGLISARKAGLAVASGEYITFVDGDDYIKPDMCQTLYEVTCLYNPDIIAVGFTLVYPNGKVIYDNQLPEGYYNKNDLIQSVYKQMMCHDGSFERGIFPSLCCKWFRRSIISQVLPFVDEQITDGEDAACTYPCILRAESLLICKNAVQYQYRVNSISMSRKYNENWYQNLLHLYRWMDKIYSEKDRILLGNSYNIEKFYAFYRYIDRELGQKEKPFVGRIRTLHNVADFPEVRLVLQQISLKQLNMTMLNRVKLSLLLKLRG